MNFSWLVSYETEMLWKDILNKESLQSWENIINEQKFFSKIIFHIKQFSWTRYQFFPEVSLTTRNILSLGGGVEIQIKYVLGEANVYRKEVDINEFLEVPEEVLSHNIHNKIIPYSIYCTRHTVLSWFIQSNITAIVVNAPSITHWRELYTLPLIVDYWSHLFIWFPIFAKCAVKT
jgi:hypothetical protein